MTLGKFEDAAYAFLLASNDALCFEALLRVPTSQWKLLLSLAKRVAVSDSSINLQRVAESVAEELQTHRDFIGASRVLADGTSVINFHLFVISAL